MGIVEFLNARLDEDEKAAKAAGGDSGDLSIFEVDNLTDWDGTNLPDAEAAHIARHDPARVLREVVAKRQAIVEAQEANELVSERFRLPIDQGVSGYMLRLIAVSYADHPDYQEAWKL